MRKILTLLVVASLFASPALAYAGPAADDDDKAVAKIDFTAAAKVAAEEIVNGDAEAGALNAAAPQDAEVAQDKLWVGIGMIAVGAGVIYKGIDLYDDEPDPFGRKKNADSYLAIGVGSVIAFFGALAVRGGLAGRGFND